MQEKIAQADAQYLALEQTPRVCFVGRFTTGKSRLINALVGADVLPSDLNECTAHLIELAYDVQERATRLHGNYLDTVAEETIMVKQFQETVDLTKTSADEDNTKNISFRYYLRSPLLKVVRLIDTPGFDGTSPKQKERGERARERAIQQSQLCVLVLSKGLGADDLECARLIQRHGVEMIVILNKSDMYDREDRQEMQEQIVADLQREIGVKNSFYACSALWQSGSEQDRSQITHQRRFFDQEEVEQWHQWEVFNHRLTYPLDGEEHAALLATIRQAFKLAVLIDKQYDVKQQAEVAFLEQLPKWSRMMSSLVGQTVLEIAASAAKSHRPLPWNRLENFGITPETVAPMRLVSQQELDRLRDWYIRSMAKLLTIAQVSQSVKFYDAVLADNASLDVVFQNLFGMHLRGQPGMSHCIQDALWYSQPFRTDFSYQDALRGLQSRWDAKPSSMAEDCDRLRNGLAAILA